MAKKKKLLVGVLIVLASLTICAASTLLISVTSGKLFAPSSVPAMPEVSTENVIIKKTLELKNLETEKNEVSKVIKAGESALIAKLENRGIKIRPFDDLSVYVSVPFLRDLLADKESQKIFKQFSDAGITIWLNDYYHISTYGSVWIDARDGVKKAAEWLETGKIK